MRGTYSPAIQAVLAVIVMTGMVATCLAGDGVATSITGYGTVGGTLSSDASYAYRHDLSEFEGASNHLDVGLESRIGVQAVIDFGSGFSVTAQELAKRRRSDDFSLGTEWLFVQYCPDSDWKLRLGRVALATFLLSDSRNVGYAAPWFRAPNEIYAAEPFQNLDGVQVLWHHSTGAVGIGLEGSYGRTMQAYSISGTAQTVKVQSMYNLAATLEYGDFLFRVARTSVDIPLTLALSATYSVNFHLKDDFTSAGLQYDNGTAIVLSEFAKRTENDFPVLGLPAAASRQWYVAGGWRLGRFTPLLIYGSFKPSASITTPAGNFGTWSASLRYDVIRNVALKTQISRAQAGNQTYWFIQNPASDERVNVYSFGADFVF
jgi:hypothetical protein